MDTNVTDTCIPAKRGKEKNEDTSQSSACLSCGSRENMARKRYCSVSCRQELRRKLNQRTGLLKALNTRYATFYFTDSCIVMDVLPYQSKRIYSFIYPRSAKRTPARDFSIMANLLGKAWWKERQRTNKTYLASRHVLEQAVGRTNKTGDVRPMEFRYPALCRDALVHLDLRSKDLETPAMEEVIRRAYRKQVFLHHPDKGGSAHRFMKITKAYEDLLEWAISPSFTRRRGFPDKWFYDGERNQWIQPAPSGK